VTAVLGVLNTTPDSFSDGGRFEDVDAAVEHGQRLRAEGADLVDVGGESTRPGATTIPEDEEQRRVLPVVAALAAAGVPVSLDTRNAGTAEAGIAAGARMINDVSGGAHDPRMLPVVAAAGVEYVVMHSRGPSARGGGYRDVVAEVAAELRARFDAALAAGVRAERLILDPGVGFSKDAAENWQVLAALDRIGIEGQRMLVGVSRKRFLAPLAAGEERAGTDPRDLPTAVLSALLATNGVWGVRVHDVPATRAALGVVAALRRAGADR
jgi:dihydropteroate synthase